MFEDAAAKFRVAAGDAGARPLVQAAAQVRAAEALLAWGARDPLRFEEATAAAQAFLATHPEHRLTARAQVIAARGLVLSGKAAEGAALYREVFAKLAGGVAAPGYDAPTCLRAGLAAARAAISTGDTLAARELFTALDGGLKPLLTAPEGRDELAAIHGEVQLGEGFAELAAGNSKAALTFFQGKLSGLNGSASDAVRSAATLGLGEALLAEGQARRASVEFARVSALDHTDRDRVARAQVRLAQCAEQLKDKDSKKNSCTWLKAVVEHFGDTPSAAEARQLIQSMGC
jgi:tetratricopeptide (TPR) repeat protein